MKKVLSIILVACISLSLCGCFGMSAEEKKEQYDEFAASVKEKGVYASFVRIETDDDGNKMLMADITNDTDEDIHDIIISYAAWDSEGNPVIIKTPKNPDNTYSVFEVTLFNIEAEAGETWEADMGLEISEECYNIAYLEALVVSCSIGDTPWENDLYEKWQETYIGVTLEEWMEVSPAKPQDDSTSSDVTSSDTQDSSVTGLKAGLSAQKAVAKNPKKQSQSDDTDMLTADITNKTEGTIKCITLAFAAWDSDGKPLMIKSASGATEDSYIKEVDMGELSIEAGATWEASLGLRVAKEMGDISFVEAIVVSFTDSDDKVWENPLYDSWTLAFENVEYPDGEDDSSSQNSDTSSQDGDASSESDASSSQEDTVTSEN